MLFRTRSRRASGPVEAALGVQGAYAARVGQPILPPRSGAEQARRPVLPSSEGAFEANAEPVPSQEPHRPLAPGSLHPEGSTAASRAQAPNGPLPPSPLKQEGRAATSAVDDQSSAASVRRAPRATGLVNRAPPNVMHVDIRIGAEVGVKAPSRSPADGVLPVPVHLKGGLCVLGAQQSTRPWHGPVGRPGAIAALPAGVSEVRGDVVNDGVDAGRRVRARAFIRGTRRLGHARGSKDPTRRTMRKRGRTGALPQSDPGRNGAR